MPYNLEHVRSALGELKFAKVTKLILDTANLLNGYVESDDERMYSHFCGYAELLDGGQSVWFKKASYRTLFIGGATHDPSLRTKKEYPQEGDLIVGKIERSAKGPVFSFWAHRAEPILNLRKAIIKGPRSLSSTSRSFGKLKSGYTRKRTEDDLWALARLYLCCDVHMFIAEYGKEEKRIRHPSSPSSNGIIIERNIVEFIFLSAMFAKDPTILSDFYTGMGGMMPANSEMFSIDALRAVLEKW